MTVSVCGLPGDLDHLTPKQKLEIVKYVLNQIESGVKREHVDYVGTKVFLPYRIKDPFTDKILKLRVEGETGKSWVKGETDLTNLGQIDLRTKEWYVYDDCYGTDQEKYFIKFVNDQAQRLHELYDEFFLLRNEKSITLFAFEDGQAFEPDYVLFLRKRRSDVCTILQLFIEPKGHHLIKQDSWKEAFLKKIQQDAKLKTVFQGRDYAVYGLPFFNEFEQENTDFKVAFKEFFENSI